jgi:hypothetical protein
VLTTGWSRWASAVTSGPSAGQWQTPRPRIGLGVGARTGPGYRMTRPRLRSSCQIRKVLRAYSEEPVIRAHVLGAAVRPRLPGADGSALSCTDDRWRWPGSAIGSSPPARRQLSAGARRDDVAPGGGALTGRGGRGPQGLRGGGALSGSRPERAVKSADVVPRWRHSRSCSVEQFL